MPKSKPFTIENIKQELEKEGIVLQESIIKKVLTEFLNCGLVILDGKEYSLSIN